MLKMDDPEWTNAAGKKKFSEWSKTREINRKWPYMELFQTFISSVFILLLSKR